ncbi:hypothetical protein D9M68_673090 [compost metagenome]
MGIPAQRFFVIDLIGAVTPARGLGLGFGQPAPAAAEQGEQCAVVLTRQVQHLPVGMAADLGGYGGGIPGPQKHRRAAEMAAGAPQAGGGRKE